MLGDKVDVLGSMSITGGMLDIDGGALITDGGLTVEGGIVSGYPETTFSVSAQGDIQGETLAVGELTVGGEDASWQSQTVLTGITVTMPSLSLTSSHDMPFYRSDGTFGTLTSVRTVSSYTAGSVTGKTSTTLYYLGRTVSNA